MKRASIAAGVLVSCWVVAVIVSFALDHGDRPIRADAIFVLSGSPARLPAGLRLMREGYAPLLVVSRTSGPTRLEQRVCAHDLPVRVLCLQAHPYSTMGEAELLARLAAARGWHRVDVVTSQYHVVRARLLIARCYRGQLRVVGAHDTFWDVVINAALESGKLVYHELVHRGC